MEYIKSSIMLLNNNEGALMVVITSVYVIATCFICWANIRSAKATREQLAESRRQFNEENRAFVTVTLDIIRGGLAVLCIENHGKQVADKISVSISQQFLDNVDDKAAKELSTKLSNSVFTLGIGKKLYSFLGSHLELKNLSKVPLDINISYTDNLGEHKESISIDLSQYLWALMYNSVAEDTKKEIASIANTMKSIEQKISHP